MSPPVLMGQQTPIRVLVLGHGLLGRALLEGLMADARCQVVGVFRWSERVATRKKLIRKRKDPEDHLFDICIRAARLPRIRGCSGANSPQFLQKLQRLQPNLILVGSWGEILKPQVLASIAIPIINCHPSLLPAFRGANPYCAAIRAGMQESGVSFHQLVPAIDAGPIVLQAPLPVLPTDTGGDLRDRCCELARQLMPVLLDRLTVEGPVAVQPQQEELASYQPSLKLEDGVIRWQQDAPWAIYNQVRAHQPWLDSITFVGGRWPIGIQKASVLQVPPKSVRSVAPGTLLAVRSEGLVVSTTEPERYVLLERFKLFFGFFLPVALSLWLAQRLFRPGQRLCEEWR
ncbi:MAG: formyltransferase family protein [Candidatus Melainabacteria bacterium]|nr:formyltransferase family protein [Candidatus Melainabacteria bacterium]